MLCGYVNDTTIALQSSGDGDVKQLVEYLKDDEVQYALIRLPEKKDGLLVSLDVYICWMGSSLSKMKAGKRVATHSGEVQVLLSPNHAQLTASSKQQFTEENIRLKARPEAGSHHLG